MPPLPRPYVPSPGMNKPAAARVTRDTKTFLKRPGAGTPPAGTPPAGLAPHAHAPVDPYANPQAYIAKAVASLGTPMTDAQIQTNAQAELAPLIKALQDSISRQAASGTNAISGYTSDLAKHLAGFQQNAQNIYGGAEASQAASDAALSQKLSGEGGQQAQDLGAKLAGINAPGAVNQAVQGATQTAGGAGNALYATGGASLANLIASGAAEQSYASKLPGLAGLAGAQQVGNLQGELAKSLADQTGTLQGKVPDIVNSLEGQRSDLQGRRATLTQDLQGFFSDRGFKQKAVAQEAKAFKLNQKKTNASITQGNQRLTVEENNAITAQQNANTSAQNASTSAASQAETARHNQATEAAAKVAAQRTKKTGGLTANQAAAISKAAEKDAEDFYHGKSHTNAQGQTVVDSYSQTYQDAIKMLTHRYPTLGRKGVLDLVNSWYPPGKLGRPAKPTPIYGPQRGVDYRPGK